MIQVTTAPQIDSELIDSIANAINNEIITIDQARLTNPELFNNPNFVNKLQP